MDDLFEVVVVSIVFFVDPCLFLSACVMGILEDARVFFLFNCALGKKNGV